VVRLWEIPQQRVLETTDYGLWPLASLMAGGSVETTISIADRLAKAPAPRQERSDLIGLLASLAGVYIARDVLRTALRSNPMIDELLNESSIAEEFIEEGARRMAVAALEGRFGPLSEDLHAAVRSADVTMLQDIVAHISSLTLEQVRARLGL
jgi:hypothetical protein